MSDPSTAGTHQVVHQSKAQRAAGPGHLLFQIVSSSSPFLTGTPISHFQPQLSSIHRKQNRKELKGLLIHLYLNFFFLIKESFPKAHLENPGYKTEPLGCALVMGGRQASNPPAVLTCPSE